MKSTIANIKASVILQALRKCKPLTVAGRAAVENYRAWLITHSMSAYALDSSIASLENCRDAGLAGVIATLKGMMPAEKRRIAVAYECGYVDIQSAVITAPSVEAMQALESLYDMNASRIIDEINQGALDNFKTSPHVANLIAWAKAANRVAPERSVKANGDVKTCMTPVLNIAVAGDDNMLVAIDGSTFLQSKSGALTYMPEVVDIDSVNDEVRALLVCLRQMHASETEPNLLVLNDEVLEYIRKGVAVDKIAFDLLGGIDELVQINGDAMSIDKARVLLNGNKDELVAAMLLNDSAKDALQIINTAMNVFEKYRSVLASGVYATKFETDNVSFYIVPKDNSYGTVAMLDGSILETKVYDKVFDVLKSETLVDNTALFNAISNTFAEQLKSESTRLSVRKQIIEGLMNERKEYEALLDRIVNEQKALDEIADANPDKVKQLSALKTKTETKLAEISDELNKLTK